MSLDEILKLIIDNLDKLGIPYMLAGSLASAAYGPPRSTHDVDIVVDLRREHVKGFMEAFSKSFYVDQGQIEQAINSRRSFNIIHLQTFFKADLFLLARTDFAREEFTRRLQRPLEGIPEAQISVATPEDTVLSKLVWYRQGGEASELQWRDVNGILKTQGKRLDFAYLKHWADKLRIADLFERAWLEAGVRDE